MQSGTNNNNTDERFIIYPDSAAIIEVFEKQRELLDAIEQLDSNYGWLFNHDYITDVVEGDRATREERAARIQRWPNALWATTGRKLRAVEVQYFLRFGTPLPRSTVRQALQPISAAGDLLEDVAKSHNELNEMREVISGVAQAQRFSQAGDRHDKAAPGSANVRKRILQGRDPKISEMTPEQRAKAQDQLDNLPEEMQAQLEFALQKAPMVLERLRRDPEFHATMESQLGVDPLAFFEAQTQMLALMAGPEPDAEEIAEHLRQTLVPLTRDGMQRVNPLGLTSGPQIAAFQHFSQALPRVVYSELRADKRELSKYFKSWWKARPASSPGLFASLAVELAVKANVEAEVKESTQADLSHVVWLPYVDAMFADGQVADALEQGARKGLVAEEDLERVWKHSDYGAFITDLGGRG